MSMKQILFNTEMVRAILDGRKTVTRRVVKPKFRPDEASFCVVTNKHTGEFVRIEYWDEYEEVTRFMPEPYRPGDILYVRETWAKSADWYDDLVPGYEYKADNPDSDGWGWRPSIHMPREAARIFLRVTEVRVERLQKIDEDGAIAEGCSAGRFETTGGPWGVEDNPDEWTAREDFFHVWDSTVRNTDRERYGWAANPWVWVIAFARCEKPEEA